MEIHGRHLRLIAAYSVRYAVRGGAGLVFLLGALLFALTVAQLVVTPIERLMQEHAKSGISQDPRIIIDEVVRVGRPVLSWALGTSDPAWSDYLLAERPALLSAIFLILIFGLPFIIPIAAFNQTAGDIGTRGIRYLLLRTERTNIFFARFVSTALFASCVLIFVVAIIGLYVGLKLHVYGAWEIISWSLIGSLALVILSLPYVAFCAWISAANESPLLSLVLCTLAIGGVLLFGVIASLQFQAAGYIKWLLPWGVQNRLLSPSLGGTLAAIAACLGYTAAFLYLGHRTFTRRDL